MIYALTPAQHAQIAGVLEEAQTYTSSALWSPSMTKELNAALAMLKAMQPVEPSLFSVTYGGEHVNNFHRAKENAEAEMQRLESNFAERVGKRKVAALYTPTKD